MRIGFLFLLLTVSGCTSATPIGSAHSAIIGGTVDDSDSAVVVFLAEIPGENSGWLCTAEVVSPHVLLTAAHCVTSVSAVAPVFTAFMGTVLPTSGTLPTEQTLQIAQVATATWIGGPFDSGSSADVAVAILATPTDIPPMAINRFPIHDEALGQPVRLIGYGLTDGRDTTGATVGTRHQATTQLQYFRPTTLTLWDLAHSNCEGDSGGPALMNVYGKERIVGVTEGGYVGCPATLASIDTRLDPYANFVDHFINQYDPAAVAQGGACSSDSDCGTLACRHGICTPWCDPSASSGSCPAGLECVEEDGGAVCDHATHQGCALGTGAPTSAWPIAALLLGAASGTLRRRRSSAPGTGRSS